jgi:acetolactate synthase-1/2/3 large subunit
MQLAAKINAPIGMSMMGIGSVPASFGLNLGMSGMHGRYASITAGYEADLIIALGVRFSDRATGKASEYANETSVIHIDIDAAEIGKNINPTVSLCGDLKEILPALLRKTRPKAKTQWLERIKGLKDKDNVFPAGGFTPRRIVERVSDFYDDDTVVTTDVGQHQMWVAQYYKFEKPRKLITSGGLGAMGYGLGAAIGASIALGRKRTVLFTGDGSFAMNLNEMATAVTQGLPITIILISNGTLGMVRQWQNLFHEKRYFGTTLDRRTDFPALAKAFGAAGYSTSSPDELDKALADIPDNIPGLVECKVDIDEKVLPMIPIGGRLQDIILK